MTTWIDGLRSREVSTSITQMRSSHDGRVLISYADGDERFALYLLLLNRVLDHIGAGVSDFHPSVWRPFFEGGYSPNDAGYEVYGREVLRWV